MVEDGLGLSFYIVCAALFGICGTEDSELHDGYVAIGQVIFHFEENSSNINYSVFDDTSSGVRVKYTSNRNILEQLGNVSGNIILVDFYHIGINGSLGYSENANIIVSDPKKIDPESLDKLIASTIRIREKFKQFCPT